MGRLESGSWGGWDWRALTKAKFFKADRPGGSAGQRRVNPVWAAVRAGGLLCSAVCAWQRWKVGTRLLRFLLCVLWVSLPVFDDHFGGLMRIGNYGFGPWQVVLLPPSVKPLFYTCKFLVFSSILLAFVT